MQLLLHIFALASCMMTILTKFINHLILIIINQVCLLFCIQNPYSMLLQLLPFSSLWSSQFLRWDIFLQYGRQVGLWIMVKVGRLWGVSFQFYIVVFVSIMELLCLSFQCHSSSCGVTSLYKIYWRWCTLGNSAHLKYILAHSPPLCLLAFSYASVLRTSFF